MKTSDAAKAIVDAVERGTDTESLTEIYHVAALAAANQSGLSAAVEREAKRRGVTLPLPPKE